MSKTTKNILIGIVIVVLAFALICLGYQHFKKEPIEANGNITKENILPDPNQGLNNMLNEILDENVNNTETISKTEENKNTADTNSDEQEENQMTPKEVKAIKLVKEKWTKEWGNTKGVSFNVSIQNDGKYLVTVYDTKSTHLIRGYIVDVTTEIVEEK